MKKSELRSVGIWLIAILLTGCGAGNKSLSDGSRVRLTEKESGYFSYLAYTPERYQAKAKKKFPLMLFLHGAGERGDDLELLKVHGPPKLIAQGEDFPFIMAAPQCPKGEWWSIDELTKLVDELERDYRVDKTRIYVTGLSMGGYGSWGLAIANPDRFAAIAPICGGGQPEEVCAIKDVPTWVFHGAKDVVVKLTESEKMVDALKACGGDVKFTVYPEANHDSWTETYDNPEFFKWILSQSLN